MKKCCDTCIHKKVCDYWEKEAHPDDYGTYDGEPCIDYFTADVVHGEWIDFNIAEWKCSKCGYRVERWNNTPFCPSCGARMDGGSKNGTV